MISKDMIKNISYILLSQTIIMKYIKVHFISVGDWALPFLLLLWKIILKKTFNLLICWRPAINMWSFCFKEYKLVICWWLSHQHMTCLKVVICWRLSHQHLHTFCFQSLKKHVICWPYSRQHNRTFSKSANMSYVDGIAVNIWHVWIHRHIW